MANDLNRKAVVFVADAHGFALIDAGKAYHESLVDNPVSSVLKGNTLSTKEAITDILIHFILILMRLHHISKSAYPALNLG